MAGGKKLEIYNYILPLRYFKYIDLSLFIPSDLLKEERLCYLIQKYLSFLSIKH